MSDAVRILLVDDDEDSFVIVRRYLSAAGGGRYQLDWAPSFERGLERIVDPAYEAALIDYRLGARDGLELLDAGIARGLDAPVILLTGQGGREIDIEAMRRGAADYLAKDRLDGEMLDRSIRYAVERHRLVKDLRVHARELADRAHELQRMNESLEQFVWAASHDLQTPLRSIIYQLQYLRMVYGDGLAEGESVDSATASAKRMSILLHDLLRYVRSGSEEIDVAPCDCAALLGEVARCFDHADEASRPRLEVGPLPTVVANRSMLGQVFQNLVQNAAVHAGRSGVNVLVSARQTGEGGWCFRVEDDGPGVDPGDAERIFEPFRRGGRPGEASGSGIGLALCRRIIERHGGRIWCEAAPGRGAAFEFTIPSGPASQPARPAHAAHHDKPAA